ncbi:predicted protein [Uncinocarpus reesii 1704]|uniref:Mcm2 3 5 family protein n=1 Tax=Uncinocarpus reesii (strain UAMH 1704) TaxID=336963 RepID=C4JGF5_UNCRE|nr:uncharacterized protein UREG_01146 [Uncinocarpus reesii 1704]EEP76297.1 predicted protein [Uncinocarpus reesii 1704]
MEPTGQPGPQPALSQPDAVFSRGRTASASRRPYERLPSEDDISRLPGSQPSSPERTPNNNQARRSSATGLGLSGIGENFTNFIDNTFKPHSHSHSGDIKCSSRNNVIQRRTSWLSISILLLAFYSTAFSGIYLVVACVKPRFGNRIGTDGGLAPSTASLLSAFFAKTIELSFVTVFVAFLGQVLSRRALAKRSPGISIADMSMRSWIMQPGTLLTHWENVRYSALTILGMTALTTAWMAMLYTTAAETLVSPKLKFGPIEETTLYGQIASKFANPHYLASKCLTPISRETDPMHAGATCMELAHVGQSYHNYQQYTAQWASISRSGNFSHSLSERIKPVGTWYDNTTVTGSWIDVQNMTELSKKYGRLVNIATAAMPHSGVFKASRDPRNSLRQPSASAGLGEFTISASVASPAVQVTCVGMTEDELAPIIYEKWPNSLPLNISTWLTTAPPDMVHSPDMLNETVVDEIFGFGKKGSQRAPIFPKLPKPYNTMLNGTGNYPLDSLYILGASAPSSKGAPYVLCGLRGGMTSKCSTYYHAAASGGQLKANCGKEGGELAYYRTTLRSVSLVIDPDWKNVAMQWASAVSLGTGISDSNSSNARLLMQLTGGFNNETKEYSLEPQTPSLAEALAAMSSSTLLMSVEDSTFSQNWTYGNDPVIEDGNTVYEDFKATIRASEYASGGTEPWQGVFYIVLVHVFLTNLICLGYMYFDIRGAQVTDFTEPQNIFALALNSPSNDRLQGACGAGPEGRQLSERWRIEMDERDEHYYITNKRNAAGLRNRTVGRNEEGGDLEASPQGGSLSPAVNEYRKLQRSRHSFTLLS